MKSSQIAIGVSYEDKKAETARRVTAIISGDSGQMVEYVPEGYWPSQQFRPRCVLSLSDFAAWAARPAGAKSPFKNWKSGEFDHQFAKKA